jgi:hypothetical protein
MSHWLIGGFLLALAGESVLAMQVKATRLFSQNT